MKERLDMGNYFGCNCNIHHESYVIVVTEEGAVAKLPDLLRDGGFKRPFIVSDIKTYKAAGAEIKRCLKDNDIEHEHYIFRNNNVIPDEINFGRLFVNYDREADVIIGVGSGVISDISRFAADKFNVPYILIATAASMDGYCTFISSIVANRIKFEAEAAMPYALIFDTEVIRKAPVLLTYAGLGDVLSKYTSICDWKLGNLFTAEYFCEDISNMLSKSVSKCIKEYGDGEALKEASPETLIETIYTEGISMEYAKSSRPVSGAAHDIACFWEMHLMEEGKPQLPHGIMVSYASLIIIEIYNRLIDKEIDWEECMARADTFNFKKYMAKVKRAYKNPQTAKAIVETDFFINMNTAVYIKKRINQYKSEWDYVKSTIIQNIPKASIYSDLIINAGMSLNPENMGIEERVFIAGILYSKEMRHRFTVLQIVSDLGLLEGIARRIARIYYNR